MMNRKAGLVNVAGCWLLVVCGFSRMLLVAGCWLSAVFREKPHTTTPDCCWLLVPGCLRFFARSLEQPVTSNQSSAARFARSLTQPVTSNQQPIVGCAFRVKPHTTSNQQPATNHRLPVSREASHNQQPATSNGSSAARFARNLTQPATSNQQHSREGRAVTHESLFPPYNARRHARPSPSGVVR
ncbi:MAG: hypothetical protein ABI779_05315, partial [Acidobacteriota bacterium]